MRGPAVSVVLPTYNRAPMLARAMRSVLAQTFRDLELIVVDDASNDDTGAIVKAFDDPRVVYLRQSCRGGVARARNVGIRASRAPLVAFQDSDDEWLLDKLRLQCQALHDTGEDTGLICGGYVVIARNGKIHYCGADARMRAGEWTADNIQDFSFIAPTWLARREALENAGLFDETLPNLEDWEFAFRLFRQCRIVALDRPMLVKHGSGDGLNKIASRRITSLQRIAATHGQLWADHPRAMARLYRELGHCQCLDGDVVNGRRHLGRAWRLDPRALRSWVFWAMSWLGQSGYRRLITLGR